jgi:hypothetical protein
MEYPRRSGGWDHISMLSPLLTIELSRISMSTASGL